MTDEPENLVLQLLREMRAEMADLRKDVKSGFRDLGTRVTLLEVRMGTMQTSIDKIEDRLERIEKHTGMVKA
jgi:phage shock protein A